MNIEKIKFASSPWGFRETPFAEQLKWLKSKGMSYYCGQFFPNEQGLFEPDIGVKEISALNELVGSYKMKCASFNVNGDFMVRDVESEIAKCCAEIDKAAQFSPEVLIVFAGWQNISDDAIYMQVSTSLKQVARHAARYNLTVALENHGGLTTSPEQINRILGNVREDNIGLNYDPANFLMYGVEPFKALQEIKHKIVFTHFKSLKHTGSEKTYCRLSEGQIDYLPILKYLAKTYKGFYAIEYEETKDVIEGCDDDLKTLKQLLEQV